MVFKTTSINSTTTEARRRTSGATLIEYLVGGSVGLIAILAITTFTIYTGRGFAGAMNYVEMEDQSRKAIDTLSREIRHVDWLTGFSSNQLTFVDHDSKLLSYTYSPQDRKLTRSKDGQSTTLLTGCDSLAFSIYQRNTTNGTYDQYPTTLQASNCKVVQVTWICSREITGAKLNTETVQTAKIVIRNQ